MAFEQEGNTEYARVQGELVDTNEEIRVLAKLVEDPESGFMAACQALQIKADELARDVIGTACKTMDACLEQEYKKGLLQGLLQFELELKSRLVMLRDEKTRLTAQLADMENEHG